MNTDGLPKYARTIEKKRLPLENVRLLNELENELVRTISEESIKDISKDDITIVQLIEANDKEKVRYFRGAISCEKINTTYIFDIEIENGAVDVVEFFDIDDITLLDASKRIIRG